MKHHSQRNREQFKDKYGVKTVMDAVALAAQTPFRALGEKGPLTGKFDLVSLSDPTNPPLVQEHTSEARSERWEKGTAIIDIVNTQYAAMYDAGTSERAACTSVIALCNAMRTDAFHVEVTRQMQVAIEAQWVEPTDGFSPGT